MAVLKRREVLAGLGAATFGARVAHGAGRVLVFAAASLQTSLTAVAGAYQRGTARPVTFSFAASSTLARQIEQGAPADIFASADRDWMDWAAERRLIRAPSRRDLLGNSLVLIESASERSDLVIGPGMPLARALGTSRLATGDPRSVPVGRYARAALTHLGVWDEVATRIAGSDNVRVALALVARGEARFGIVYATDARVDPRVRVVGTFPAASHPPIVYPFALTATSTSPDAQSFFTFLVSPEAGRLFESEGFTRLP